MNTSANKGRSDPRPLRPAQSQSRQPGLESCMSPRPVSRAPRVGDRRLDGVRALITGGDSGIGRAVAIAFAREGADVAIGFLNEHEDAERTRDLVEDEGGRCSLHPGDIGSERFCRRLVRAAADGMGGLDVLINNAAVQRPRRSIEDIDEHQLLETFRVNIFSMFFLAGAALPVLRESRRGSIINTASVTAYRGSPDLVDYAASKGAIVAFTRSLSQQLAEEGIRVNAVAPGPIWTPLIPATFPPAKVARFGSDVPMGRAGEPWEVAGAYVFLAGPEATYITGQVIHVNGGEIINS